MSDQKEVKSPGEQRKPFVPPVQEHGSREAAMITLESDETGRPTVWCDPEIASLVSAFINAGIRTVWSCSGHGHRPGVIRLKDGRHLMVFDLEKDFQTANSLFKTDINGISSTGGES